jgi:hypothetical protein
VGVVDYQQRRSVRRSALGIADRDPAIAARFVVDQDGLSPELGELVSDMPDHVVRAAAG